MAGALTIKGLESYLPRTEVHDWKDCDKQINVVRVLRGPLKDLLIRLKNQARLVLSVELLSRSVSTEANGRDVEVMRAAPLSLQRPRRPAEYSIQIQ